MWKFPSHHNLWNRFARWNLSYFPGLFCTNSEAFPLVFFCENFLLFWIPMLPWSWSASHFSWKVTLGTTDTCHVHPKLSLFHYFTLILFALASGYLRFDFFFPMETFGLDSNHKKDILSKWKLSLSVIRKVQNLLSFAKSLCVLLHSCHIFKLVLSSRSKHQLWLLNLLTNQKHRHFC